MATDLSKKKNEIKKNDDKTGKVFGSYIVCFRTGDALRVAADSQAKHKKKIIIKCHSIYMATVLRKFR